MFTQTKNSWLLYNQNRHCILCGLHACATTNLCQACLDDLPWITHACQRCAIPLNSHSSSLAICPQCQQRPPLFDQVIAPFEYRFPIDQLIQLAKFNGQTHYLNPLADLLRLRLQTAPRPELIIPVPLHQKRLQQRQYNQAALLAKRLARSLSIPFSHQLLIKAINTPHQADLDRKTRRKNLRNSFHCINPPPASVAVIDDVMTTGTTAAEISRVLKQAGCQQVYIWVIARTAKELHLS
ncbi:ComF family protein [Amphritea sp. 1_MG-2023]|uniref:ComF family protein n=1 Tax=Amphritea sp. 1_MG-2023 TaxID=3062670 RepID=UPI0026E12E93|nr:ComF family protein [Amphritea sp. 1_MG-2023]MDO6562832.1 ComF family protein [Amphritea sp. 1_MG-2023]